jgi:hypothetical protein
VADSNGRSAPSSEPAPTLDDADSSVERDETDQLLERVAPPPAITSGGGELRVARIVGVGGGAALIAWRGRDGRVTALVAPGVEMDLLEQTVEDGGMVLVEDSSPPLVVGVLQTRRPRELKLSAETITIEGEREVLIRSGRAAIRLREDGDIEIVGSRISAASRGLFRLVGRILRLN